MSDEEPTLPEITPLDEEQVNRLVCADWLEGIAKMLRNGIVVGLDIAWDPRYPKPVGQVMMSTDGLYGSVEMKLKVAEMQAKQRELANKIPVQDVSADPDLADHKCNNPMCVVCNNAKNTQKS